MGHVLLAGLHRVSELEACWPRSHSMTAAVRSVTLWCHTRKVSGVETWSCAVLLPGFVGALIALGQHVQARLGQVTSLVHAAVAAASHSRHLWLCPVPLAGIPFHMLLFQGLANSRCRQQAHTFFMISTGEHSCLVCLTHTLPGFCPGFMPTYCTETGALC